MAEESAPPGVGAIGDNVPIATRHELKVDPIEDRSRLVGGLMLLGSWSSYKKEDRVFDRVSLEMSTAPFRIITEDAYGSEFSSQGIDSPFVI